MKKCYSNNKLVIKYYLLLNSIKGDPYPNMVKKLYIEYYNKDNDLVIDEYNEIRNKNINYFFI